MLAGLDTVTAAVGFALIFGSGLGDFRLWSIAAIMLLVQFSISALNEWADADLDRQAGRQRPIALGLVSPGTALTVTVLCAVGAFLLSTLANFGTVALLLVGIGLACGWAYDLRFKASPLSFLPFAIAFPLMPFWIGLLAGRPASSLGVLFLGGSPLAAAIHLADAIPDRDRDRAAGLRTLAVRLGRPGAEMVAAGALLANVDHRAFARRHGGRDCRARSESSGQAVRVSRQVDRDRRRRLGGGAAGSVGQWAVTRGASTRPPLATAMANGSVVVFAGSACVMSSRVAGCG